MALRSHILHVYQTYFPNRRWDLPSYHASGAYHVMTYGLHEKLNQFQNNSRQIAKTTVNQLYKQSILRHAWVLDQTTPPSFRVRIPHKMKLMEAQVAYYRGADATRQFEQRWNAWNDAYYNGLLTNLKMNALNSSTAGDAADEVDATRVNTPASGLMDALQRIYDFESSFAINDAIRLVSHVNEEAEVEQIWETRRNATVCDDCDENEGLSEEECDDEIPLHPNCRCYWRMVPKEWAEMLRSGNAEDYETAVDMDSQGLVPTAMAIKDLSGDLAGQTTVTFGKWSSIIFR